MPWVGNVSEKFYYNPTTNRIPLSILGNWQRFALDEADSNDFEGIDTARYDDIPTAWLGIAARVVSLPIQPVVMMNLAERQEKLREIKAEKKAAKKKRRRLE